MTRFTGLRDEEILSMSKCISVLSVFALLGLALASLAQNQTDKPPEWTPDEKELADKATKLHDEGKQLYGMGRRKEAADKIAEALEIRRKLYAKERFKDGHPELAESLSDMGAMLLSLGEPGKAVTFMEQGLVMRQQLYPKDRFKDGQPDLASSLHNLGGALDALGEPGKALTFIEQGLAMRRQLYPKDRFENGHPELAASLTGMGIVLRSLGEPAKALTYYEQALAMNQQLYPKEHFTNGHPALAGSLNSMGVVLASLGESGKALTYFEQALAMYRQLYPKERFKDGHPLLAGNLNNMANVLQALGESDKALSYFEQALAMNQQLYPKERFKNGHPVLASSLNNMGFVMQWLGESRKALTWFEQGLAMRQQLYPKERFPEGHPELAGSLNNMGFVLNVLGESDKALTYYQQAHAMNQQLYPAKRFKDGHTELAKTLAGMGVVLLSRGESGKALASMEQALVMYNHLAIRQTSLSSEAQTLAYRQQQPRSQDLYLTTAVVSGSVPSFGALWSSRGGILPLLQARHQSISSLTRTSDEVQRDYRELVSVRQALSRLQTELPRDAAAVKARDERLTKLNDDQDRLERALAAALPSFKHLNELAEKGPADLAKKLPKNTAFVDFIRFVNREKGKGNGQRYVAFVVLPDQDVKFLQLGEDAKTIDDAVAAWRKHIDTGEDSQAPAKLRELVWDKIAKELLPETKAVYLCPDGDLARLPFAALPGAKKGTVLLEDYAVAVVPSGPWLLEQLLYPPKPSEVPDRVLAVGDIAYGKGVDPTKTDYPPLPATRREIKRVLEAFGQEAQDGLAADAANTEAVRKQLEKARYAHFATHGYFDEKTLSAERVRLKKYLEKWEFQIDENQRLPVPQRNPAAFVGLVLAGANDPNKAGADGGILTGLSVVDLPLENLRLCVLSACETGLGDLTEGEGVMGLQRAFHAAGCPNVVGSLWKVDDAATAALMTQFYHELRITKSEPLAALREAQLTIYRHPERIGDLAGERGKPALDAAAKLGSSADPKTEAKTTPTKLWAAFVLSGRGE
jgi:CHAT domain-containing protein